MVMCWVPDCKHYYEKNNCKNLAEKWVVLVRRSDATPTDHSKICSCHFVNQKKENLPTIFKNRENQAELMTHAPQQVDKTKWNILKKNKNKTYVKDKVPEFKETTLNIIEVYIKEEEMDIEQHELENYESEISQQPPQGSILETTFDETVKRYEETCFKLTKQNEILKQDFSKVMIENKIIKKNFLDFVTNSEELKTENKVLKEQL